LLVYLIGENRATDIYANGLNKFVIFNVDYSLQYDHLFSTAMCFLTICHSNYVSYEYAYCSFHSTLNRDLVGSTHVINSRVRA